MSRTYSPRQIALGVIALAILVYANTLANGFVYDDISIVQSNPYITDWRRIPWLFTKGYWSHKAGGGGNYRPLAVVTFALEYAVWGIAPMGYHLTNILLHAANVGMVFHVLRLYRASLGVAGVSALVFAVHPVHTDAVASVVGRGELLGMFFGGLMWWAWVNARQAGRRSRDRAQPKLRGVWRWRGAAALAYLAALLSKENMITLPAALWLAEVLHARRACLAHGMWTTRLSCLWHLTRPFWVLAVPLVPYFWLRSLAGEGVSQVAGVGAVPLAGYTLWQRAVIMLESGLTWYRLLFVGYPLRPHYDGLNVTVTLDWTWGKLAGLLLNGGLVVALWLTWRRAPLVAFAIGFWFITLAIVSNVPIPLGALFGERWLYVPSAGYAVAFGYGVWLAWGKAGQGRWVASAWQLRPETIQLCLLLMAGCTIGSYVYRTTHRNLDWRDNYTLFSRFIETDPQHPTGYVNIGDVIMRSQPEQARVFYEKALELEPRQAVAGLTLAAIDIGAGAFEPARKRLERMLTKEPPDLPLPSNHWSLTHALYAQSLAALGERERGRQEAQTALRYAPDAPQALLTAGEAFVSVGERSTAIEVYRRLVSLLPHAGGPRARLGVLLLEAGDAAAAERELTIAAQQLPDSPLVKDWLEQARRQAAIQP
ncbi:hypothetical protein J8C06_09150 [Chloracidobacterium validum]|uniref:Tetratricopeptide repeat protein n=1 Tax=Chloracidobacterium validum TaxID=2821543 RepID=A0ABX8B6G2_9BACT|nr:tetratricopeptide repeat protein [Chloracidobacterium validum]QUW02508.1 hypothetical protein J8C06_09150 [Chloracidobacterium validum]